MTKLQVGIEEFAHELHQDLPRLIKEHPKGLSIHHLRTEYGESAQRVVRAVGILERRAQIVVSTINHTLYIQLPKDSADADLDQITDQVDSLTELQNKTLHFIRKTCEAADTTRLATSYMQLARVLGCSSGGMQGCIKRLIHTKHLLLIQASRQGEVNSLILGLPTAQEADQR